MVNFLEVGRVERTLLRLTGKIWQNLARSSGKERLKNFFFFFKEENPKEDMEKLSGMVEGIRNSVCSDQNLLAFFMGTWF